MDYQEGEAMSEHGGVVERITGVGWPKTPGGSGGAGVFSPSEARDTRVTDILRPLAEALVVIHGDNVPGFHVEGEGLICPTCGSPRFCPDPRYDALRRPIVASDYVSGPFRILGVLVDGRPWTLDTSLGAIIEAAAAIGIYPLRMVLYAIEEVYDAAVFGSSSEGARIPANKFQEAAARALVAAWRDEKRASA